MGDTAERLVEARLRDALPADARLYANVPIVAKTRPSGPAHDAEADLVIVDADHGLLVIETKAGAPTRDASGRWWLGRRELPRSPFKQAEDAKHDLITAIRGLPDWPRDDGLRAGHAVAFPDADLASLAHGHALLGPDMPRDLILDAEALGDTERTRRAMAKVWAWWVGDGSSGHRLDARQLALIHEFLAPTLTLRRLLRRDVTDGGERLLHASNAQKLVLNQNRSRRRVEVIGPAGSGKSLVAVERARRLAREGFRTLFVCFNQPLATEILRGFEEEGEPPERRPVVTTFHRLCEQLGTRAGVLPPKPSAPLPQGWWNDTLPNALADAIEHLPDERFQAIVVDEGQDFRLDWLVWLQLLFANEADGVFWVFHDPGQALRADDAVGELGLERLELYEDYRSPGPVAALAARFYRGPEQPVAMNDAGLDPVIRVAARGRETVEAVRRELHRLIEDEDVRPWHMAVLSGQTASRSEVWRQRHFGNVQLWNGAIDDEGNSLGLPADQVPDEPKDGGVVRFETVRRFKGLERPVVILCELDPAGERFDQLLYTALTRVTVQLVLVVTPELALRLRTVGGDVPVTARGGVA
jgi:UvrD-like helicase C-terminal domain/Nuclease-related domain/AAA domain